MRSSVGGWAVVVVSLAVGCGSAEDDPGARPSGDATWGRDGYFRDDDGRAVLLRGVNVSHSAKRSPTGLPLVDQGDFVTLRADWGVNLVRLTVFWRFFEPVRGEYDAGYLAAVRQRLDWAHEAGVSVLLDMHQDLFGFEATHENEGDGPPAWARDPTCAPFADRSPWFFNYFDEPVDCQFRAFWADTHGAQSAFIALWEHVLADLGAHPALVGVDLWNEPWVPKDTPAAEVLTPFYERIIPRVRAVAPRIVVFYEPGTLSGQGEDQTPPRPPFDRLVFAPHFYPAPVWAGAPYPGHLDEVRPHLEQQLTDARDAEVPLVVGEWGAERDGEGYDLYVRDLLHVWQDAWVGSARWSYDRGDSYRFALLAADGALPASTAAMIEPYAERVPGTPLGSTLALTERRLTVRFEAAGPSELVLACPRRFCAAAPTVSGTVDGAPVPLSGTWVQSRAQYVVPCPRAGRYEVTLGW